MSSLLVMGRCLRRMKSVLCMLYVRKCGEGNLYRCQLCKSWGKKVFCYCYS
jgi:hypothetical protein